MNKIIEKFEKEFGKCNLSMCSERKDGAKCVLCRHKDFITTSIKEVIEKLVGTERNDDEDYCCQECLELRRQEIIDKAKELDLL